MGSVTAVVGDPRDLEIGERLDRMLGRSPHRGAVEKYVGDGFAVGIQSLGWDAALWVDEDVVVGLHGYVGNWGELSRSHEMTFPAAASSAERIAIAYRHWEKAFVGKLRGEFGVVVFDRNRLEVMAARDVVGCRPLFVHDHQGCTYLATEVRQCLAGSGRKPEINDWAVVCHLVRQPPDREETLFLGVDSVLPGDLYEYRLSLAGAERQRTEYWSLSHRGNGGTLGPEDWVAATRLAIQRAVERALPDRPFAVTLSGGLDSTSVWALISRLRDQGDAHAALGRPISLVYPRFPACDETEYIDVMLDSTAAAGVKVDASDWRTSDFQDEMLGWVDWVPFATLFSMRLLAEAAQRDQRSVLVSGLFGDHWFDLGSPPTLRSRTIEMAKDGLARVLGPQNGGRAWNGLRRFSSARNRRFPWLEGAWGDRLAGRSDPLPMGLSRSERVVMSRLKLNQTGWPMPAWDQVFSRFGVEGRHPFGDPDLVAVAARCPASIAQKALLKAGLRAVMWNILPGAVANRADKTSLDALVRDDSRLTDQALAGGNWALVERGLLCPSGLDSAVDGAYKNREDLDTVQWLFMTEAFIRRHG